MGGGFGQGKGMVMLFFIFYTPRWPPAKYILGPWRGLRQGIFGGFFVCLDKALTVPLKNLRGAFWVPSRPLHL